MRIVSRAGSGSTLSMVPPAGTFGIVPRVAGVLAAISEATGWDPRRATVVVGTSAGSITGAS